MTVRELRLILCEYPDDQIIVEQRYSDWKEMSAEDWIVVRLLPRPANQEWFTSVHESMTNEQKAQALAFLAFKGN